MFRSLASKRYNQRMLGLSLLYCMFLLPAVYGFKHHLVPNGLKYVVALLPALPIVAIFGVIGRYLLEEQDEYVRMLMVRQTLWASAFSLSATTVLGFLQSFDLMGRIDSYWIVALWFVGLGLGRVYNQLTLGCGGC